MNFTCGRVRLYACAGAQRLKSMKSNDRNLNFSTALGVVAATSPKLVGFIGLDNAANLVSQIYNFYDSGRVVSEHYTPELLSGVEIELTVIASPERISVIGQGTTHYVTAANGYVFFDDLAEDLTNIARLVQLALQWL